MNQLNCPACSAPLHRVARNAALWVTILLVAILSITSAHAACSTKWQGRAWFNEYFFGSGTPNFLEVYSNDNAFPAKWQGWSIDVYSDINTKTTYPLTSASATACTVGNKTWLTSTVVSGLRQQDALVLLKDDQGAYVDAFVFDNKSPPAPWPGSAAVSRFPALNTAAGCPELAAALTSQAGTSATSPKQYNMLVLGSFGNKDMARDPDGGAVWDLTDNTGAGTTYTQCVSNNANFTKTVDNSTPAPGSTVTYTLSLANTGNSPMSGVQILDSMPPAPLNFVSATPSNPSDPPVTMGTYSVYDPYLQTSVSAPTLTWSPAPVPANSVSMLYVKMQVAANAVEGRSYLNTAQTLTLNSNQTDFANVTIGSANTPSFAITVSPASSTTCTPAQLGPKVTITAMSAANGGGTKLTSYNGTVTLTTSRPTPRWYNSAGVPLTGNTVTLQNGEVSLYLTDSEPETFTVSAIDASTYQNVVMYGTSGNITFTDSSTGMTVTDADYLSPAYGVVAGRPHAIRATVSSCGAAAATTGTYTGKISYVPGLNHPAGATAPTINPTSPSCPGTVPLPTASTGADISLAFKAGVANFYLCGADVGQYALKLTMNNIPTGQSTTAASSNFTVRPFAITATGFTNEATNNPLGAGPFARAGASFSGTLKAWPWVPTADADAPRGDGLPDNGITAATLAPPSTPPVPRFSGTVNNAGVVNLAAALVAPAPGTGKLGTFSPGSATLTGGIASLNNTLSYSEVGSIRLAGTDAAGKYAVTNYLGAAGVNVPLLSDVIGRFIPDRFQLSGASVTGKPTCSGSTFSYMGEPFNIGFTLTALNAAGVKTENYEGGLAFLDPATANWAAHNTNGSFGLGAFDGVTDRSARFVLDEAPSAGGWVDGSNQISASVRFERGNAGPDGPFSLSLGVAPRDLDGVTVGAAALSLGGNRAPVGSRIVRFGRMRPFSTFVSGKPTTDMVVQTQYWSGKSWVLSSQDGCTVLCANAVTPTVYLKPNGEALSGATLGVQTEDIEFEFGGSTLTLTRPSSMVAGSVDLYLNLGAVCPNVPNGLSYLSWFRGMVDGIPEYSYPTARATFGVHTPETRRLIHVRELF